MLFKLALRNVKRQISNYIVYFITVTLIIALVFAFNNLIFSDIMDEATGGTVEQKLIFVYISEALSIVVAFVLCYATAFLLRRRKKEFGLYLTLGMTRSNILVLFIGETLVTFLFSLGIGILLGMGLYQVFMAMFVNFLQVEFKVSGFSAHGSLITVLTVAVMFVIASLFSLIYLKRVKISRLLYGEKPVEKTSRYPVVWLLVAAAAVVLLVASGILLKDWIKDESYALTIGEHSYIFFMFVVAVIALPFGVSKSVVPLFVRHNEKTVSAKGTAVFTMRQLSGRLNSNSVMAGVLTFLLLFSIIMPSMFLTINTTIESEVRFLNYYDVEINLSNSEITDYAEKDVDVNYGFEKEIEIIEKYSEIKSLCKYSQYKLDIPYNPDADEIGKLMFDIILIAESDYNQLCLMTGKQGIRLNGGYYAVYIDNEYSDNYVDLSDVQLVLGGIPYENEGNVPMPDGGTLRVRKRSNGSGYYFIIPDKAVNSDNIKPDFYVNLMVMLKKSRYDSNAMLADFSKIGIFSHSSKYAISLFEAERLSETAKIALWLLGFIFVAVTFILLSMAVLALKMLTLIGEDRQKYKALWRIGTDKKMIFKSLLSQMFFYYFIPFLLPLILFFPMCALISRILGAQGYALGMSAVLAQTAIVFCVILLLYALYFMVTYLIARRDVGKTLQSVG